MNSANYVDQQIKKLIDSMPKLDAVWQLAKLCIGWPYIFGDRGQYCTPAQRKAVYNKNPDQDGLVSKCKALSLVDGKATVTGDCAGCKWYPGGLRVRSFDCRGFTYWVIKQIYNWELYGTGCTSQWNTESNWKAKGEVVDGIPQNTLVCVFYFKKTKQGKRTKTVQHTGLYYNGETIECSNGVQYSKTLDSKWDVWGVPVCVEGDVPTPTPPDPDKKPTLKKGDSGSFVTLAQTELIQKGYSCGSYGADGKFGSATEAAVERFQADNGIKPTGVINQETWVALGSVTPSKLYTVSVPHLTYSQADALKKQYPGSSMLEEKW